MDIPLALERLAPTEDWGPCAGSSNTYAELAAHWRGKQPVPTEAAMLAEWASIQADDTPARRKEKATAQIQARINDPNEHDLIIIALQELTRRVEKLEAEKQVRK